MKNLSLIRRFTIGSMILGLVVPMIYHISLNVRRYSHFNNLAKQLCKAVEPNIQIGGRQALEYLNGTVASQGIDAFPEVEFKDHGELISPPVHISSAKFRESCIFEGISGVEVNIYYNKAPILNITYLYMYLTSVPLLFLLFMLARAGVMRVQRKVADLIEGQMKQLLGIDLDSKALEPKTSIFYKLFDLEIPLLRYLKKYIENLEDDLKKYSQKIADQQKREVLMDVAAQMAHDIVTPIATLQEILKNDRATDHQDLLLMEITQIKKLSEKLLRQYRGEPATPNQQLQKIDIAESIKIILKEMKIFSQSKRPITFEFSYDSTKLYEITGDSTQFIAAISNILRNSIEAMDKKESSIEIFLSKESNFITLSISDNGCGIREEHLAAVFKNKVSIGKKNGTGIGLYQVKSSIESMSGKIDLKSKVGLGTTIEITWQLNSSFQNAASIIKTSSESSPFKHPDLILIDDTKANHTHWNIQARRAQKSLMSFYSLEEFAACSEQISKSTPIFVDYTFENGPHSGKEIAEKIISEGFENVHIATGHQLDRIECPHGIKSVLGKDFPSLSLL